MQYDKDFETLKYDKMQYDKLSGPFYHVAFQKYE